MFPLIRRVKQEDWVVRMPIQINLLQIKNLLRMRTGQKESVYVVVKYLIVGELAIGFAKDVSNVRIISWVFGER